MLREKPSLLENAFTSIEFPNDQEAEKTVLGSILMDSKILLEVWEIIEADDFWSYNHRLIFNAFIDIYRDDEVIDIISVTDKLVDKVKALYITEILNFIPTTGLAKSAAIKIRESSLRRKTINLLHTSMPKVKDINIDIQNIWQEINTNILALSMSKEKIKRPEAKVIVQDLRKQINEYKVAEKIGFNHGIPGLSFWIPGVVKTHIWTIGGSTSTGKTQFMWQLVYNLIQDRARVNVYSLEMSREQNVLRLISYLTQIPIKVVLSGKYSPDDYDKIRRAEDIISSMPLNIYEQFFDLDEIYLSIRRDQIRYGVDVVVIDYIQNIISSDKTKYDTLSYAAVQIMKRAKNLNIATIVLSQISKEQAMQKTDVRGYKGAGEIENATDIGLWLERPKKHSNKYAIDLAIGKNRQFGTVGTHMLEYNKSWTGFEERFE